MLNEKDVFSFSSEAKLCLYQQYQHIALAHYETVRSTLLGTWSLLPDVKYSLSGLLKKIKNKYGGGKYHLLILENIEKSKLISPFWHTVYDSRFEIGGEIENILQSKQRLLNETICPGISVWSKATGKGPWITLSPVDIEVGLNTGNILHQIPKVAGWIVRDNEGKDHAYPEVELTFKPSKIKELVDEISWKSKLFYGSVAFISAMFSSLCYLKLLK